MPTGLPAALSHPCPRASCSGIAPGSALPRGGKRVAELVWEAVLLRLAGFVMGCVFPGLAGRHVRGQQEQKLQVIYEGA